MEDEIYYALLWLAGIAIKRHWENEFEEAVTNFYKSYDFPISEIRPSEIRHREIIVKSPSWLGQVETKTQLIDSIEKVLLKGGKSETVAADVRLMLLLLRSQ